MSELNAHDLVVVDEFGCNLDLTCCYSRAPIGVRACGSLPRNTPANQTVIASLQLSGMGPSMRLSGAPIRQPLGRAWLSVVVCAALLAGLLADRVGLRQDQDHPAEHRRSDG